MHQVPGSSNSRPRVSWSVNLLGSWEELACLNPVELPEDEYDDDDDLWAVDDDDAERQFTSMLQNKFGHIKEDVKRPQDMPQRKPQRK